MIPGDNKEHDIKLFTLSTCGWCRRTKKLLREFGVEFHYVDVDVLSGKNKREALLELKKYNPKRSFPTLIIDENVIIGYQYDEIIKYLGIKPLGDKQ